MPNLPEMQDIWQETLGWQPDSNQQSKLEQLYLAIVEGNRQLNLTRITESEEFWEKHLWDSLAGVESLLKTPEEAKSYIDIGTGAGFPGIPVAIVSSQSRVTLLDSTGKKIAFLADLITQLQLNNATTLLGRAEAVGKRHYHRENYDIALIRAVGKASVCAEYALPLIKVGGTAILYRGNWSDIETQSLSMALKQLRGKITEIKSLTTPLTNSIRHCIYIRKLAATPNQFPRAVGVATQKPL